MATDRPDGRRNLLLSLSCAVVACSMNAHAEGQIGGAISAGIARTDNLALSTSNEEAETVYQVMPSFSLQQESTRIASQLAYQMDAFRYESLGEQQIYNRFDGRTTIALDPDNFFFDLGANRSQAIRDPRIAIPRGNLPISGNRIDRDEAYAGPWFQYPIGRNVVASGSYRRSWTRYDDAALDSVDFTTRDADSDALSFSVNNYRRERGFSWAIRYNSAETDYHIVPSWKHQEAAVEFGAWAGQGWRLFVSGGKESPWEEPFESSLEDTMWEAGLNKTAGERFSLELAAGERSFGHTKRARLDVMVRRGRVSFGYVEEPTTQDRNPFVRGGLFDPFLPDDFLAEAGRAQAFISKRMELDASFELRRTQIGLAFINEQRERRILLDETRLPDIDQSGASVRVSRQLGARTDLRLAASRYRRQFELGNEVDLTEVMLGASYSVGPRSEVTLDFTRSEDEPRDEAVVGGYTANTLSFLFTRTF